MLSISDMQNVIQTVPANVERGALLDLALTVEKSLAVRWKPGDGLSTLAGRICIRGRVLSA